LGEYLESRNRDDFILVELGHRLTPILPNQKPFIGSRAYIGVEADLRNPYGMFDKEMQDIKDEYRSQNVFFTKHDTGGRAVFIDEGVSKEYEGEYNAKTILPNGVADEVFVGNVFGDYHIAWHKNTQKLLRECSRIVDPNGMIVIRETITPHNVQITDEELAVEGLRIACKINEGADIWCSMEDIYSGSKLRLSNPNSFYLVLQKQN
jgi:hypothetical protein